MSLDEKLTQVVGMLERLDERTQAIQKEVSGNGQPGLKQRVEDLEGTKNKALGAIGVISALGVGLWGFLEYCFHFMKGKS